MGLFSRKPERCAVCGAELGHRHRPRKEWGMEGLLCGECHVDKAKEYHEGRMSRPCAECGAVRKITDLWEPRWQWDMEGLLCKGCFDSKEEGFARKRSFCAMCGAKMGFIRYRPKPKWNMVGRELCRGCWDAQKAKRG